MKFKIYHGKISETNEYFVISIFDDENAVFPLKQGLKRFFEKSKLKEKIKKESNHGYISLSGSDGSSSG